MLSVILNLPSATPGNRISSISRLSPVLTTVALPRDRATVRIRQTRDDGYALKKAKAGVCFLLQTPLWLSTSTGHR